MKFKAIPEEWVLAIRKDGTARFYYDPEAKSFGYQRTVADDPLECPSDPSFYKYVLCCQDRWRILKPMPAPETKP